MEQNILVGGDGGPVLPLRVVPSDGSVLTAATAASPAASLLKLLPNQVFERTRWQRRYASKVRCVDALVVFGVVGLAQYVRFGPELTLPGTPSYYATAFSCAFAVGWLSALSLLHTRSANVIGSGIEEYRRVVAASFWTFGAIAIITLLLKLDIARGYLAVALPIGTALLVLNRSFWRASLIRHRSQGRCHTAVLAFGDRDVVRDLALELGRNVTDGYHVVGIGIPGYGPPRDEFMDLNGRKVPIVGEEAHMIEAIRSCGADTVAIAGTEHFGVRGIRRLIWDLEPLGVDLVVSTGAMDVALSRLRMLPMNGLPLLHIEKPQYRGAIRLQKRVFDIVFALTALIVAVPVLVVAALAIKLTSRGPLVYCSERIGIDGQPFSMLKFRTMVADADRQVTDLIKANETDGLLFKIRDDPRVTPVGRVLRKYSIDELPQFINVLRNEMSVVGPRPPLRREVEAYDCDVLRRLLVKPGVTGLWQVSGRSDLSWNESVRLDLSYVENWSMTTDAVIIAKTVGAVLRRSGAY